ncbi:TolC family protein, partial [Salmonella enterica]|uniref:TolC family protein n=1 Tax=Salmonella enterica TaxID=28901 RepID=UPI003D28C6D6
LRGDATTPAQQPAASWWTALGDPVLDDLVASGLRASPTMAAAQARIDAARATLAATRTAQLPTVGVGAAAAEVSLPGGPFGA